MIYGLWHGGPNYSLGYVQGDTEEFTSVQHARATMNARYHNRDGRTPCVESDSMTVWFTDPRGDVSDPMWGWRDSTDQYPDLLLERGPRGGIRQNRC
jgi:hypothetical protein